MSDFEHALPVIMRHEGGYCNNPNDPGGPTKYGISLRWLKAQGLFGDINHDLRVDIKDIIALTPETAGAFYRVQWWDRYGYGRFPNQIIATKLIDTAINVGAPKAHRIAQEAAGCVVDGILGPNTVHAINVGLEPVFINRFRDLQAAYYRNIAQNNPKLAGFLDGWMKRAYDRA
jgi:lysozyme family protein